MDSPTSREKKTRKNIANILKGLGFKDTPQSRKFDPWMTRVLARDRDEQQEQRQQHAYSANYNKRSFNDLDSICTEENKNCAFVNKRLKKKKKLLSVKKQRTNNTRSRLFKKIVSAPTLPEELRNKILGEMDGSDLVFVTKKVLTSTDVSRQQGRFSIPQGQVANEFLHQDEKALLKMGISVKLMVVNHDYQPCSDEIEVNDINLTMWMMTSSFMYALNHTWNFVVEKYKLKTHLLVQLWAFRVQSQLYFALVKLQDQLPEDH